MVQYKLTNCTSIDSSVQPEMHLPVVAVQAVPVYWAWVGKLSFCTYAYAGLVRNEFEGLQLLQPLALPQGNHSTSAAAAGLVTHLDALKLVPASINVMQFSVWGFIGVLACMTGGTYVLALICTGLVTWLNLRM